MTDLLNWLNPTRWLLAGALVAAVVFGVPILVHRYDDGQQEIGEARVQAKWDKAERDRLNAEAAERARLDKQRKESDRESRRLNELAQANRAAADAAAGKLRDDLAAYVARSKAADPAPVGERPPAASALDLLAGLLQRADEEAGILADYADRARIAGQQCERDYDALTR